MLPTIRCSPWLMFDKRQSTLRILHRSVFRRISDAPRIQLSTPMLWTSEPFAVLQRKESLKVMQALELFASVAILQTEHTAAESRSSRSTSRHAMLTSSKHKRGAAALGAVAALAVAAHSNSRIQVSK